MVKETRSSSVSGSHGSLLSCCSQGSPLVPWLTAGDFLAFSIICAVKLKRYPTTELTVEWCLTVNHNFSTISLLIWALIWGGHVSCLFSFACITHTLRSQLQHKPPTPSLTTLNVILFKNSSYVATPLSEKRFHPTQREMTVVELVLLKLREPARNQSFCV